MSQVFDYVKDINSGKQDLSKNDDFDSQYIPYIVNLALSYFQDTVLLANEMNMHPDLSKKAQYKFLLGAVSPRKRFAKWNKKKDFEDLEAIRNFFKYDVSKAKQALRILSDDQITQIKNEQECGGVK